MSAVAAIIAKWPNKSELARDLGLKNASHIGTMQVRMQINPFLWPAMVESARRHKVKGVSIKALYAAHAEDEPLRERLKQQRRAGDSGDAAKPAVEPARAHQ